MTTRTDSLDVTHPVQGRWLVPVVTLCCGVTVANVYLALPLLTLIATSFGLTPGAAGVVATLTQVGYALGLFFLVSLGDAVRRRRLVGALVAGTTIALIVAALAPGLWWLAAAAAVAGGLTVIPQILIPLAVHVVPAVRHGRTVAAVQAGMMAGILLSRVIGGQLGEHFGWRSVYWVAAALTLVVGVIALCALPREQKPMPVSYGGLIGSLFRLLRDHPALRWACLLQILIFGAFNLVWTSLVFLLTGAPFHYSVATAGWFGLFGLASVVVAPYVGRSLDRHGPRPVLTVCIAILLASSIVFLFGQKNIAVVIVGIILINIGVQGAQIANQTHVFTLQPDARSRLNTVFMVSSFAGGAIAAQVGTSLYGWHGWTAVGIATTVTAVAGAGVFALGRRVRV